MKYKKNYWSSEPEFLQNHKWNDGEKWKCHLNHINAGGDQFNGDNIQ
jgi:hypothetical protein